MEEKGKGVQVFKPKQQSRILRSKRKFKTTPFKKNSGKILDKKNVKKTLFESEIFSETGIENSEKTVDFENYILRLKFDLMEPEEKAEIIDTETLDEISSDHEIFTANFEEWILRLSSHCDKNGSFSYLDEELEWESFLMQINKIVNEDFIKEKSTHIECVQTKSSNGGKFVFFKVFFPFF